MILQFKTGDVTFFDEDKDYFRKRFQKLEKMLGFDAGDEDSVEVRIQIEKTKQSSGNRFLATANVTCPRGSFHAEATAENIKKCADELKTKLRPQVEAFHGKRK
jgi:ribosome-associated translation inhibitor RaiA